MGNFRELLQDGLGLWQFGILTALFIGMYFHRFNRKFSRQLRWCLLLAFLLIWILAAIFGKGAIQMMNLFWPFIAIYAWAFFMVLLDRLQFDIRFFPLAIISVLVILSALPLLLNVLPPRAPIPYPPYYHPFISFTSGHLEKHELLTTDMPWATAWYGDRTSLLLPRNVEGFYEINIFYKKINAAYFTTLTRDKPWARQLLDREAPENSWYPILQGIIPNDFPLSQAIPMGSDQLFIADYRRW
jgi:hypothetical protein